MFRVQLRALARCAPLGPLKVMLPMVTAPQELAEARTLFRAVVDELRAEGQAAARPPLGIMVEVPAAALSVADFDADFLSIGTNDLVQYVTAVARDDAGVAALYDPLSLAVLRLIREVAAHGAATGPPGQRLRRHGRPPAPARGAAGGGGDVGFCGGRRLGRSQGGDCGLAWWGVMRIGRASF